MTSNSLSHFSQYAARLYLQSAVFIDDNIYNEVTAAPNAEIRIRRLKPTIVESPESLVEPEALKTKTAAETAPEPQSIGLGATKPTQPPTAEHLLPEHSVADQPEEEVAPPFRTKDLVACFAEHGIVCALYEPPPEFPTDENSVVFKLCDTADLVALDWDFNEVGLAGGKPRELIRNLINNGNQVSPHHVRLIAIYTTTPVLSTVANSVFQNLEEHHIHVTAVDQTGLRLQCGSTRIIVLGKELLHRQDNELAFSVKAAELAARLIDEFASLNSGLMPSFALLGMAAVKRNSLRILNKFPARLDGQFLLHRALVRASGEAFEDLSEILADEIRAVIEDSECYPSNLEEFISNVSAGLSILDAGDWQISQEQAQNVIRRLLHEAIPDDQLKKVINKPREAARLVGSGNGGENAEFAALLSGRTLYRSGNRILTFGTIVMQLIPNANGFAPRYSLCFMPACDSIRLAEAVTFPFWILENGAGKGASQCVVTPEGVNVELVLSGKANKQLWTHRFSPGPSGCVEFVANQNGRQICSSEGLELEWATQLKPAHAQRLAHEIGAGFSRVGLLEAEWLRLQYKKPG